MKKTIMFMMAFLVSMFVMVPVHAEEAKFESLSDVEVLLPSDSFIEGEPTVEGNGTDMVVITFDTTTFKMAKADPGAGKPNPAGWAGVRVFAPKGINITDLQKSMYDHGENTDATSWWTNRDSKSLGDSEVEGQYFDFYGAITEEILTTASQKKSKFVYTYRMDWDGDSTYDQTVKIIFNPAEVTLQNTDENDNTVIWTEANYLTTSNQVKLTYTATYSSDTDSRVYTDSIYLDVGTKVTEDTFATLKAKVAEDGFTIAGYYSDEGMTKEFDFDSELEQTNQIYMKLVLVEKAPAEVPSTGDNVLTYAVIGAVALISVLGTAVYFKKVNE